MEDLGAAVHANLGQLRGGRRSNDDLIAVEVVYEDRVLDRMTNVILSESALSRTVLDLQDVNRSYQDYPC